MFTWATRGGSRGSFCRIRLVTRSALNVLCLGDLSRVTTDSGSRGFRQPPRMIPRLPTGIEPSYPSRLSCELRLRIQATITFFHLPPSAVAAENFRVFFSRLPQSIPSLSTSIELSQTQPKRGIR